MKSNNKFKTLLFVIVSAGIIALCGTNAKAETVEISLERVFIPATGYGSNNNVLLTLDGRLPSSCYQLAHFSIDKKENGHSFIVHQFAEHQTSGICAKGAKLPLHLSGTVPFTYDVTLGHLPAGHYKVNFDLNSEQPQSRAFEVYHSENLTADDLPYAVISNLVISDFVNGNNPVSVELTGTLLSNCSYLENVKVTYEEDVVVIQPILGYRISGNCYMQPTLLKKKVDLGLFNEGRFLLHVRTMSGNAINRAFSVLRPDLQVR